MKDIIGMVLLIYVSMNMLSSIIGVNPNEDYEGAPRRRRRRIDFDDIPSYNSGRKRKY